MVAAIAAGRDDTTADPVVITEEVLSDLQDPGPKPPVAYAHKLAEERLDEASQILKDEGMTEHAGLLAAQIGIGYALLAIRDDNEVFFAGGGS